eukprot:13382659-Alexandrium_andersonii.AAC.1
MASAVPKLELHGPWNGLKIGLRSPGRVRSALSLAQAPNPSTRRAGGSAGSPTSCSNTKLRCLGSCLNSNLPTCLG